MLPRTRALLRACYATAPQQPGVLRVDRSSLYNPAAAAPRAAAAALAQAALQTSLRAAVGRDAAAAPPEAAAAAAAAAAAPPEDTPLAALIRASILGRGPLSMADYTALCLSHPQFGYYMQPGPVLGRAGDFTTSPELSQLFGELVGVWVVAAARATLPRGGGGAFCLAEGGPGRGTLAAAVLAVLARFPAQARALQAVHLVETSPPLREAQAAALGCAGAGAARHAASGALARATIAAGPFAGTQVHWWDAFAQLPRDAAPPLVLCHELFDALPVHQLARSGGEWRELLVDVAPPSQGGSGGGSGGGGDSVAPAQGLRNVLSPGPTPASASLSAWLASDTGARYLALCEAAAAAEGGGGGSAGSSAGSWPREGDVCEVSPASQHLFNELAQGVRARGGAALVVDYGPAAGARRLSLRGIRRHAFVDVFAAPGAVDLSADVDFAAFRAIGGAVPGVRVLGPAPQGRFLQRLGLGARLARLCESAEAGGQVGGAEALAAQARRLAHPEEMGAVFKALAVVPEGSAGELEGFFE